MTALRADFERTPRGLTAGFETGTFPLVSELPS
jgi:hypothetical protein